MVNEFYSLSQANEDIKIKKQSNNFPLYSKDNHNKSNESIKYFEFPNSINHKNFSFFSKSENEKIAIFELTINRIKEYDESLGLFYLQLKKFFNVYWQNPKSAFEEFNVLKSEGKASNDNNNIKNQIVDFKYLFKDNRYKFRRNLNSFLINEFACESKQLVFFLDSLVFTFNDYDFISKLIVDFMQYIDDYYDIELETLYLNRKIRKH